MARSPGSFNKREQEKKRLQKRKEKEQRKEQRKAEGKEGKSFEDMIAYVDEYGNLTSTPPDVTSRKEIDANEIDLTSANKGGGASPHTRQGVIKYFDTTKGFGFIRDDQTQEEYFFHHSSADFPVAQGNRVVFETERGPKGMNAVRISKRSGE